MRILDFQKALSKYHEQSYRLEKTANLFLDPHKKIQVTFVGYSWNNQGAFLHSIFPEYFFAIFPGIWLEFNYICPVNFQSQFYQLKEDKIRDKLNENPEDCTILSVRALFGFHLFLVLQWWMQESW